MSSTKETVLSTIADDPYQQFVVEQEAKELQLDADRAAKRAKIQAEEADTEEVQLKNNQGAKQPENLQAELPDVTTLRQQLEAKTEECEHLNRKLIQMESEMRVQKQLSAVCALKCCSQLCQTKGQMFSLTSNFANWTLNGNFKCIPIT